MGSTNSCSALNILDILWRLGHIWGFVGCYLKIWSLISKLNSLPAAFEVSWRKWNFKAERSSPRARITKANITWTREEMANLLTWSHIEPNANLLKIITNSKTYVSVALDWKNCIVKNVKSGGGENVRLKFAKLFSFHLYLIHQCGVTLFET